MDNKYSVRSTAKAKWRQRQSKISMTRKETAADRQKLLYGYVSARRVDCPVSRWEQADKIRKKLCAG